MGFVGDWGYGRMVDWWQGPFAKTQKETRSQTQE